MKKLTRFTILLATIANVGIQQTINANENNSAGCFSSSDFSDETKTSSDLITQQVTVNVAEAGTLGNKLSDSKKYRITNLKIIGEINAKDIKIIREMADCCWTCNCNDKYNPHSRPEFTKGNLEYLDLSEAKFIGDDYIKIFIKKIETYSSGEEKSYYAEAYAGFNDESQSLYNAFHSLRKLKYVILPSEGINKLSDTFNNCTSLISVELPSSLIELDAFYRCKALTTIKIPTNVTKISHSSFYGCTALKSIEFYSPSSLTSIESHAFDGCKALKYIEFPSSLTNIGDKAFYCCTALNSIVLPSSLTSIGDYAFNSCNLYSIYSLATEPAIIGNYTFRHENNATINIYKKCTLYVPQGSYTNYWAALYWENFMNIKEFDPTNIKQNTIIIENVKNKQYTLDGKLLHNPQKGINLIKYTDGTVQKVFIK